MNIKAWRMYRGMPQNELAKVVNISSAYLCDLESGKKNNPNIQLVTNLARALKISVDELLSGKLPDGKKR